MTNITDASGRVRVENRVTSGTFSLDGETFDVDNNVWVVGDDAECLIIDPAHDVDAVVDAVAGRRVLAILLTHGHDDHIRYARDVASRLGAEIFLNGEDSMLWDQVFDAPFDRAITDGQMFRVGGVTLSAIHTPGHSPGSTCFYAPDLGEHGVVFSGDTLFNGGPGATGRSFSSFETIIESITEKLFPLPEGTVVLTGHGDATSIGAEKPHLQEWLDRGH